MKANELVKGHCYIFKADNIVHVFQFENFNSPYPGKYIEVHYTMLFTLKSDNFTRCEKESTKLFDLFEDEFLEIDTDTFFKIIKSYKIFNNSVKSLLQESLVKM